MANRARIRNAVDKAMTEDLSDRMRNGEVAGPSGGDEAEIMIGRGLRLPVALDMKVREIAAKRGVAASTLIRQWIEMGVAGEDSNAAVVPLAELEAAIARLSRRAA